MSETSDTREFCRRIAAKPINGLTYPLIGSEFAPPGWPDRFVCWPRNDALRLKGWHGFIEFKAPTGKLKETQQRIISKLIASNVRVAIVFIDGLSYTIGHREYTRVIDFLHALESLP